MAAEMTGGPVRRRVLHVIYSLYRGGAERLIETHLLNSGRTRYEFFVCSLTGGSDIVDTIERAGAGIFLLEKRHRGDVGILLKLASLIRREGIDLLHLHNPPGTFWGTLAVVLCGIDIPVVRTEHRPYMSDSLPLIYRSLYPYLSGRAARIICVSENVRDTFIERFPGHSDKFVTILNGVCAESFDNLPTRTECRERFRLPGGVPLIGSVGRLVPVKNYTDLLEAFCLVRERIPDAHLAILGEGALKEKLTAHAVKLGVNESVFFLPATPHVACFLRALDIFALSSRSEGLPLTLLEAMATGLPAVATDVGGIPEIIDHGENGYIVPGGSPVRMAERIVEVLQVPEKALSMGSKGREKVIRRFSARSMAAAIERVYDDVLECRRR